MADNALDEDIDEGPGSPTKSGKPDGDFGASNSTADSLKASGDTFGQPDNIMDNAEENGSTSGQPDNTMGNVASGQSGKQTSARGKKRKAPVWSGLRELPKRKLRKVNVSKSRPAGSQS